jgi:hypothetical protein
MATQIDYLAVSLLDNFTCDLETIPLSPELSIVRLDKLSDPKAKYIFGEDAINLSTKIVTDPSSTIGHQMAPIEVGVMNFILRPVELSNHTLYWRFIGEIPDPLYENFDQRAAPIAFSNALTALRLLKPGFVGRYPTRIIGEPGVSTAQDGFVISMPNEDPEYLSPNFHKISQAYVFESADIEFLKLLLGALTNLTNTSLQIAISRLNSQYTRNREDERLIDAVVALEAIYLSGVNNELKFRLAIRAATHLGNGDELERARIFNLVKSAYDLRSALVHGSLQEITESKVFKRGSWKTPDELLKDITSLLRSSLRSILTEIGEEHFGSQFHNKLDTNIIEGTTFQNQGAALTGNACH